ncbi:MAG: nucleoside triphosphate pyrophosphohydrolase family protein [Patescibacteria group bacterium]
MTFEEYQRESRKTANYPDLGRYPFVYPTLGLTGEAGEVAEKIKKVLRDKDGIIDDHTKQQIAQELGDVLWYVAQLATELGLSLEDVASMNLEKLFSRLDRGVISGSGDQR